MVTKSTSKSTITTGYGNGKAKKNYQGQDQYSVVVYDQDTSGLQQQKKSVGTIENR